jgi:hypothetical protein
LATVAIAVDYHLFSMFVDRVHQNVEFSTLEIFF